MTRIIVCSDSHGSQDYMSKLFEENSFDFFFFLGDGLRDLGMYTNLENVYAVRGNCDFFSIEPVQTIKCIENLRILATHGNIYGVKQGMGGIIKEATKEKANIVLFGHTHNFLVENIDDIWYFNPGSLKNGSAILLEIKGGEIKYKRLVL